MCYYISPVTGIEIHSTTARVICDLLLVKNKLAKILVLNSSDIHFIIIIIYLSLNCSDCTRHVILHVILYFSFLL